MTSFIPIALIGWIPVCLILFATIPRRQAVVIAIIGAWIFLPPTGIAINGLPNFTKGSAFVYGILLGTLLFMPDRLLQLRLHWLDLPMICFCLSPFPASMTNGLGAYDGASGIFGQLVMWGSPYLVGRIHFKGERSLHDLLVGLVVGGLVLIPFCLFEIRMSQVLLPKFYGVGGFQGMRLGGWRPRVFFWSGLELGMWMTTSVLSAYWLWRAGTLPRLLGWPVGRVLLPALLVVTLLCRSSGSLLLLALALAVLWACTRFNNRLPMLLLLSASLIYVGVRVPNYWDYSGLISFLNRNFSPDRAQSLEFRFQNEDILIAKAVQKPLFGWGGWGRSRVYNARGKDITITDGLWVIILGPAGTLGLGSFLAVFLLPCTVFVWRYKPREWGQPVAASQAAFTGIVGIYMIDCMLNAFPNAVYVVGLGSLVSCLQIGREDFGGDDEDAGRPRSDDAIDQDDLSGGSTEARLADRYVDLARNFRRTGAHAEAASAWRHALEILTNRCATLPEDRRLARRRFDCTNDLAWFLLSRPDPEPGDRAEAADLARQATQADPDNPVYWNTLAAAFCRVGDDLGALEAVQRAMDLEDVSTGFDFVVLALAHARLGRKDEAARWLVTAREWRDLNQTGSQVLDDLIQETDAVLAS